VTAHDVADLVRDDAVQLVIVQCPEQGAVHHDEWLTDPVDAGVEERVVRHEHRRRNGPVEDVDHPVQGILHPGELVLGNLHGARNVEETDGPFGRPPDEHLHQLVESGDPLEHAQGRLVGRMLPRGGTDARQFFRPVHQHDRAPRKS
jgi:hypothetical protein